jgi:hypothetical protein
MLAWFQAGALRDRSFGIEQRLRVQCRRLGVGPEANRASVRLLRQVKSELSVPPGDVFRLSVDRFLRPHGATV